MKKFNYSAFFRLMKFTKSHKNLFSIAMGLAIFLSLFTTVRPLLMQILIDDYIVVKKIEGFLPFIVLMTVLLFLEIAVHFIFIATGGKLAQSIVKDMRDKLFKHILSFKWAYFDKVKIGTIVTRVVSDIEVITNVFEQGLLVLFADAIKLLGIGVVMFIVNWRLTLIVFMVLPVMIYSTKLFQKFVKKSFQDVRNEIAKLNSFVQEHIMGMKIVQLFNQEKREYQKFKIINKRHKDANIKGILYYAIFFPVVDILSSTALGLVVWFGGLRVALEKDMTLGDIIAFIFLINMLFRPLRQMADKFNTLQMGLVASERVFKVLDNQDDIEDIGTHKLENIKGDIVFKNVVFSYIKNEVVIKNISFEIERGQTVAIVGETGSGKSTIISLLNKFYQLDSGQITVDDMNLQTLKTQDLRKNISVILQDGFLFSDSIYKNVALGNKKITHEKMITAAKQIGIHNFITSLPDGYNYNVKERGSILSVGQRQLISFLRAYLQNPAILILDEATSSVDTNTEILIQKAIDKLTQNRTSIIIAHRLGTIKKADKIIVMKKGKIVEMGMHNDLIQKEKGYYKKLYKIQFEQEV